MARKYNIKRSMHKDMIYGALMELVKNRNVWHESTVSVEYSHLTDEGKDAIVHVVEEMFRGMQTIQQQEIKEEAKRQTLESLK
jgi:acid stress-induced BolA-like protein IbaG/YrbA